MEKSEKNVKVYELTSVKGITNSDLNKVELKLGRNLNL